MMAENIECGEGNDEVLWIMDMWGYIEKSVKDLSNEDKKYIENRLGRQATFSGFNESSELECYITARSLANGPPDNFIEFRNRSLKSHTPMLAEYRRMMSRFKKVGKGYLSRDQIVEVIIGEIP